MRRSHLYQIIYTLIPTIHFQRLSVPPQTSYPLFTYQPDTHLVPVRLRININIHLLSVKDYNQIESPPPLSFNAAIPHKKRSPQPDEICDMGRRGRRASCVRKSVEVNGKWRRKTFCSPSKRTGRIRRVAFRRLFSDFHFPEWPQNGCDSHFNCSVGRPWKVQSDRGEGVWGKGGALCRCREQNPIPELDNHIQTVSDMRGHCA